MSAAKFNLRKRDREQLMHLVSNGKITSRMFKRATGLLELERGRKYEDIAETLGITRHTVGDWRAKYKKEGLAFLNEAPRTGRPSGISGEQRAKITALACSEAPEGYARWNLRLLADKIVELEYCEGISHTQVSRILKKTNSSRTSRKRGASGR